MWHLDLRKKRKKRHELKRGNIWGGNCKRGKGKERWEGEKKGQWEMNMKMS
jgi:hypothetical protein